MTDQQQKALRLLGLARLHSQKELIVDLRAVHQRRAGERTGLQCLRAVRVYRSRVCKIVS